MKFKVIVTYDSEYDGYMADVPELVGCMSQEKTIDESLNNIKDAIRGWIEVEKKYGRFETYEPSEVFLRDNLIPFE